MATTLPSIILRLRRLIDDVGHGYSQSAPDFTQDLTDTGWTSPSIGVFIDEDATATDIVLSPADDLTTGMAIAAAIQRGVRASGSTSAGYLNFVCTFHREEGYVLRSGSQGSASRVSVVSPVTDEDAGLALKLGLANGGYESEAQLDFSDAELAGIVEDSLAVQNGTGVPSDWEWDTIPEEYENVVVYRAWATVVDTRLGRTAAYYPQKVAAEETEANVVFDNYLRLAKWLKFRLDDTLGDLESQIECTSTVRWDPETQQYVGTDVYFNPENIAQIKVIAPGTLSGEVILEFSQILNLDVKNIFIAYSSTPGVFDPTLLTEESRPLVSGSTVAGLAEGSTLARSLRNAKNTLVKIKGLTPDATYYFAIQVSDQNGNRYFSNEASVDAAP